MGNRATPANPEGTIRLSSFLNRLLHFLASIAAFGALLWLAGCATGPRTPEGPPGAPKETQPVKPGAALPAGEEGPEIKIGILLPLSGDYHEVGQALLNAATMALFDIGDSRLKLLPVDTKGTPAGAVAATRTVLDQKAAVILGPLLGPSIRAATPAAQAANVRIIGFSSDRTVADHGVYLLSFMPGDEIRRIIYYAARHGHQKIAAMIPETPYGEAVLNSLHRVMTNWDNKLVDVESYPPDTSKLLDPVRTLANYDFRKRALAKEKSFLESFGDDDFAHDILDSLSKLETLGSVDFDAVLVPEGAALLRAMAPLFPYYEVNPDKVKLLGTGLWNDRTLLREPQLIGGWFAAPDPTRPNAFFNRYDKLFKTPVPRITTLGYDAVALVATLAHGKKRPDFSDRTLMTRNGFAGLDGIFRFTRDGTTERGLAVLEVQPSGFRVISPAPRSFANYDAMMAPPPPPEPGELSTSEVRPENQLSAEQPQDNGIQQGTAGDSDAEAMPAPAPDSNPIPDEEPLADQIPQ